MLKMPRHWMIACCLFISCTVDIDGCGPIHARGGTEGELGHGIFYYTCLLGTDDALCDYAYDLESIPGAVAVAGLFTIRYESYDTGSHLQTIPASHRLATSHADEHALLFEGLHAFFAIDPRGAVYDLVHVRSEPVSGIGFDDGGKAGLADQILLCPGESAKIEGKPLNSAGEVLGGTLDWSWQIDSPQVASLIPTSERRFVEVVAQFEGQAIISAAAGGTTGHLTIVVDGGCADDSDTDSDFDSDTGTDTDRLDEDEEAGRHP